MIMARFVLEIGTEEIPSRFLKTEEQDLARLFAEALDAANLAHGAIHAMSTPRRLALVVEDVAEKQGENEVIVTGPPLNIAYGKDGAPTKALAGFAASNGVSVQDVFPHHTEKGEYVACRVHCGGQPAIDVLAGICPAIIESLPFAKSMRWGDGTIFYARPLRWILALHGAEVVPFSVGALSSGRTVQGHRVHGAGPFYLDNADNYERLVADKCNVVVDPAMRRAIICEQGDLLAKKAGGNVLWKDSLLEETAGLVECPVPLLGDFDSSYLEIPEEVLLTSMETHQKSFGLRGADGRLLPHFLTVLNIRPVSLELVKRGWERVLRARLEDARFFWRADLGGSFDGWLEKLDHVIFIGPLGSMGDKARRLAKLCQWLAEDLALADLDPAQAARAGLLAKADLVSSMVGEFDTLQGVMGGIYAEKMGENPVVAQAIKEQYLPAGPDTPLPRTAAGAILSLADKADTLAGCFGLNKVPTGAADPNGLRRCALGIIRILLARGWHLDVDRVFERARELYGDIKWKLGADDFRKKLSEFFQGRLRSYLIGQGYEGPQVDAVLAADSTDPVDVKARLDALVAFAGKADCLEASRTLKRVENMGRKSGMDSSDSWDKMLLEDEAEKALSLVLDNLLPRLDAALAERNYAAALAGLEELRSPVDDFFDNVLVLCENMELRQNRLKMLNAIRSRFAQIACFSMLQI